MTTASTTRRAVPVSQPKTRPTSPAQTTVATGSGGDAGTSTGFADALFVVATHKVRDHAGRPSAWLPYGTEHAWRPGTRRTLCGEWISGWTVFWERRFSARPAAACPRCIEATLPEESRRRLDRLAG